MDQNKIEERLEFIEFRQELLFNNSNLDRILFEYKITRRQYEGIMDIMDKYRDNLKDKITICKEKFEEEIYNEVPHIKMNYHFCESIARAFMEQGRWEEVFPAIYGDLAKYGNNIIDN